MILLRPRRRLAMVLAALMAAAVTAAPAEESKKKRRKRPSEPIRLELSLRTGYDDNILQLSESEIDLLEQEPDSDRFRIDSEDDIVNVAGVVLRWRVPHRGKRRTILRGRASAYRYLDNGIKDYEVYGARLSQELITSGRHRAWLSGEYRRTPSRYSREVTDDDASDAAGRRIRDSLAYGEDRLELSYRQRILGRRLETSGELRLRDRDYDDDFDERDGLITDWSVRLRGRPWSSRGVRFGARFEWGDYDADGDLPSTPIRDDDVSYEFNALVLETDLPIGRHHEIGFQVEWEARDFTTTKRQDRARFDRNDDRVTLRAGYRYELSRDISVWGTAQRKSVDADLPASAASLDEETDYEEVRISVGLNWDIRL